MDGGQKLVWDEIVVRAENLEFEMSGKRYDVWVSGAELNWTKMAWQALERNELTTYRNLQEKNIVKGQLLTLAAMYCQFLEFCFDKMVVVHYDEWFEQLELDSFLIEFFLAEVSKQSYIGRALYEQSEAEDMKRGTPDCDEEIVCDIEHDSERMKDVVRRLIDFQWKSVYTALISALGGVDALHLSLLKSQQRQDCREWLAQGMYPQCSLKN